MNKLANVNDLGATADALGEIRAEISRLKKVASSYEDALVASKLDVVDGRKYRVAISYWVATARINWRKMAEDLGASAKRIAANTKYGYSNKIRVSALKK